MPGRDLASFINVSISSSEVPRIIVSFTNELVSELLIWFLNKVRSVSCFWSGYCPITYDSTPSIMSLYWLGAARIDCAFVSINVSVANFCFTPRL